MRSIGTVLTTVGIILIAHFVNEHGLGPHLGVVAGVFILLFGLNWIIEYCADGAGQRADRQAHK